MLTRSRTWLKTTDNCYVAEVGLHQPADKDVLDNCGPIGFIQANWTGDAKVASRSLKPITLPSPETPPNVGTDLNSHYLVNITVGEDYAFCHSCPNSTCDIVGKYAWKHEVWVQCYVDNLDATNANETYWYETTDFCYVHEGDFEQSLFDRMSSILPNNVRRRKALTKGQSLISHLVTFSPPGSIWVKDRKA